VTMCGFTGSIDTPASVVKFHILLTGTASHSGSDARVLTQAFGSALLNGDLIQCTGDSSACGRCTGNSCLPVEVPHWDYAGCTTLDLRAAVGFADQHGLTGWDAEAVADFADTLKLVAIEPLDDQGHTIPGLQYSITDAQGTPVFTFPQTPPPSTTTSTTLAGTGTTTTSTLTAPPASTSTTTTIRSSGAATTTSTLP